MTIRINLNGNRICLVNRMNIVISGHEKKEEKLKLKEHINNKYIYIEFVHRYHIRYTPCSDSTSIQPSILNVSGR
jgi:hypothetical protein